MTAVRLIVAHATWTRCAGPLAWALLLATGCSPAATSPVARQDQASARAATANAERLLGLVRERLLVMHDVARWKWRDRQPVQDAQREAALVEQTKQRAAKLGLDAGLAVRFMGAQMAAAKMVQQEDMARWEAQPPPAEERLRDLKTELRPQIDRLNAGLLESLARLAPQLGDEQIQRRLVFVCVGGWPGAGLSSRTCAVALEPLLSDAYK